MKIVIIGSGNVAYHFIKGFSKSTAQLFVHARNRAALDLLKLEFDGITILTSPDLRTLQADVVLMCVKDDALNAAVSSYTFSDSCLVAHTSGTQTFDQSKQLSKHGVFYPLQTFSKSNEVHWHKTPILIEATSEAGIALLEQTAQCLYAPYFETNTEQRKAIHVAAVLTSNFANHLIGKAAELLQPHSVDYHILQPLLEETIRKAFANNPFDVQTGPAVRQDVSTIQRHQELLKSDALLQKIYADITESIQKTITLDTSK